MVKINDLSFAYPGKERALKDVNIHINPGDCILITGESGSGKSSLFRILNGLAPYFFWINTLNKIKQSQIWGMNNLVLQSKQKFSFYFKI